MISAKVEISAFLFVYSVASSVKCRVTFKNDREHIETFH